MAACHDQHARGDQLLTNMGGRPRVPGTFCDARGFGEYLIMTIGQVA
jgi:hypothetical protein